jgi:hypothetical protein
MRKSKSAHGRPDAPAVGESSGPRPLQFELPFEVLALAGVAFRDPDRKSRRSRPEWEAESSAEASSPLAESQQRGEWDARRTARTTDLYLIPELDLAAFAPRDPVRLARDRADRGADPDSRSRPTDLDHPDPDVDAKEPRA